MADSGKDIHGAEGGVMGRRIADRKGKTGLNDLMQTQQDEAPSIIPADSRHFQKSGYKRGGIPRNPWLTKRQRLRNRRILGFFGGS